MNPKLPEGFISIDDAIKLINEDTRENAKVDTSNLVRHIDWLEIAHNFRIPKLKTITDKNTGQKKVVSAGDVYITIRNSFELESVKHAILEHFREMSSREYIPQKTRAVTTVADESEGMASARPRRNKKPIASENEDISQGHAVRTINDSDLGE